MEQANNVQKVTVYYGFLEGSTVRGTVPCTLEAFALSYLKRKVNEAGYKYNDKGRAEYVDSCRDLVDYDSPETVTREEAASEAAHILVFSNTIIVDMRKKESVPVSVLNAISDIIQEKLMSSIVSD
jgi:hypothetical protein